ncbi:MAG: hypothetical protein EXQ96_00780 [Alphaproteobacteria bacterium]|nr:hypothetical protein [Alphaproteobacteria bacterium]
MAITVCLGVKTLHHPRAGGHFWAFLNWALGLKANGCRVIWAEEHDQFYPATQLADDLGRVRAQLAPYGLGDGLAAVPTWVGPPAPHPVPGYLAWEEAASADLFLNFAYAVPAGRLAECRRTALVDIDPGLLQYWMSRNQMQVDRHDLQFTIGETVGQPGSPIPTLGLDWIYTPPCVALDWWRPAPAAAGAAFTTVTHWGGDWAEDANGPYPNDKRTAFLPYLDLPTRTAQPLELAVFLAAGEAGEAEVLQRHGWRVGDSLSLTGTPADYRRYIQGSLGEFSCAKPSCRRMANAWISDRTLCYLASGKPAVVEHTGASRFLPEAEGLFRFTTPDEAARYLDVAADPERGHGAAARALAERHFDAATVTARVLERALG